MAEITAMRRGRDAASPRRRPVRGGYARGDETRAQIVAAALVVFAERGYHEASTREIATEAGVNPPALQYYFGGKEGLHRACAEFIIDRASVTVVPALVRAEKALRDGGKRAAADALYHLLDALTHNLSQPGSESLTRFMARGKADGAGPAMEMIRERIGIPVLEAMAALIGAVTGATGEIARLRTLLILGQVHWMHANRDQALKVLGWTSLDADRVALIKALVREHTRSALGDVETSGAAVRRRAGVTPDDMESLDRRSRPRGRRR
jgi:TetR/AcrR family transcriptional regulator, regulator of cefoperazone and chloramphenicol sensitivity